MKVSLFCYNNLQNVLKNNNTRTTTNHFSTNNCSFKGTSMEIDKNKSIDNFIGANFMASDNAYWKNISATKVYIKDNATIENLTLTKGYRDRYPYQSFKNVDDNFNNLQYQGYPPDLVVENNATIKKINSKRDFNNIKLICETSIPQIPVDFLENNTSYFVFGKNIKYTKPLKAKYVLLKDDAKTEEIKAHSVYLKNFSKASSIQTQYLVMEDNAYVERASVNYDLKIKGHSSCKDLTINKGNSYKREVIIGDNVSIGQLKALQTSQLTIKNDAKINKIIHKNSTTSVEGNSCVNDIDGFFVEMFENATAENIKALSCVKLFDNSKVKNIQVTDTNNPRIYLSGEAKINGQIYFPNAKGKVILMKDKKTGKFPEIESSMIINGEIIQEQENPTITLTKNDISKSIPTDTKQTELKGFAKVAGMEELKEMLREDVIYPLSKVHEYSEYGLEPINGFLLYGPPGCGKTYIANALAEETGRYFVEIPSSSVGSIYQHQTVKNISNKFDDARINAPSIIFIDEVEAMAPSRENLADWDIETNERVNELLQQINKCKDKNILVIFASNEPQKIDKAIKRTGRIDKKIYLGPPDEKTRKVLFQNHLKEISRKEKDLDIDKLAKLTKNYIAEDIRMIIREAAISAMRKKRNITMEDMEKAIKKVPASLTDYMVESYKRKGEI